MRTTFLVSVASLLLVSCVVTPDDMLSQERHPSPTGRVPVHVPADPAPTPTTPLDSPGKDPCASTRFVSNELTVKDLANGNIWFASDMTGNPDSISLNPSTVCAPYNMRAATMVEILELTALVPHPQCRLPSQFTVYSWTDLDFFEKSPRPIIAKDGCVDLVSGEVYHEECKIPGPDVARSTMCVR